MKKILGVLLTLLMIFGINAKVNAASDVTVNNIKDYIVNKGSLNSLLSNDNIQITSDGNKRTINVSAGSISASAVINFNESTGEFTYERPSNASTTEGTVIDQIVDAICGLKELNCTASSIKTNITNYNYDKYGIEGTVASSAFTKLNMDTKNMSLTGNRTVTDNTNSNNNVSNPKTGVFLPVAGLSILIIGSVVCLLWISRKNVFRGL